MANKILAILRRRIQPVLALILVLTLIFSTYSLITKRDPTSVFTTISSSCSLIVMIFLSRLKNKTISKTISKKIDEELVLSILHMYVVSQGDAGPDQLVSSIANMKEYGYYSRVFRKIREIAKDFGYGFAKAMTHMADLVKPPLKDILIRCTEALSTPEPKEYLELENSTLFEEYSGQYLRSIESIRTLGGVYGTFQSVSVFIVMTLDILSTFINMSNIVYYSYVVSAVAIMVMFLGFKAVVPKETLVYIDKNDPPRLYQLFKFSFILAVLLSAVPAVLIGVSTNPSYGFIIFGASLILPGLFAYRLESLIVKIDEYYPTFIKALCENMASTSSIKSALSYVLHMELGPLKGLVKRALARLRLGIRIEKSIDLLSSESASYRIYTMNRMLLDTINYGGDLIEVGKILGDSCIKFLEFRKRRSSVAKSFKTIIFILHPVTVALLVILTYLCRFFSQSMVSLPYFSFGEMPVSTIHIGNALMILFITTLNALALREAEGGFWGTSLLYIGLLLILSGISWFVGEKLMDVMFGQTLKGFEKLFV